MTEIFSKTVICGVMASLLSICAAGCENSKPSVPAPVAPRTPAKPIRLVAVNGDTFDFGTAELAQEFSHEFVVKNAGEDTIIITAGTPSCATCTEFKIDKQKLKPNESAIATVKWKVNNENPEFRHYAPIFAHSEAGGAALPDEALKLHVVGKVTKRILLSPLEKWNVGDIEEGKPGEFAATVTSDIIDNFQIESITKSSPFLTVTATPFTPEKLTEHKVKVGYDLKTVVEPKIAVGEFNEKITFNLLAPHPVPLVVDITGRRSAAFQIFGENWAADHMLLNLGSFDPRSGFSARLNLFTRGVPEELKIEKVTCPDERFSVELKVDPKFVTESGARRKYDLIVKVAPSERAAVHTLQAPLVIEVDTNQPLVGKIKLKIRCSALP